MKKSFIIKQFRTFIFLLSVFLSPLLNAQVNIVSASINAYNITPRALSEVSITNTGQEVQATLEAQLYNSSNELLMSIKTNPFTLRGGLNMTAALNLSISNVEFGSGNQANYVRQSHVLPSGQFKYCCKVLAGLSEDVDEFCMEVESDMSSFLLLVSPENKDTIDTQYPNLVWNHSEPFNLLPSGAFFRMVVVELSADQTPEAGVSINVPIMTQNYLRDHNVIYPFNGQALKPGKRYGWQVQVLTNGIITNKTEAWEFRLKTPKVVKDNKYATLKPKLDGSFYTTENNKVFFKFDEAYLSGSLICNIYDSEMKLIKSKVNNEEKSPAPVVLNSTGDNRFVLNLDQFDVSEGYYLLEVKNEMKEVFMLRFLVK